MRGGSKSRRRKIRERILERYKVELAGLHSNLSENEICARMQDITFPLDLLKSEKLMVILVPEHNVISGGIYSFFSIAEKLRRLKSHHGYDVMLMTRPNPQNLTYYRNTNFRNCENVYRFEQILMCESVKDLYLHIPEYEAPMFAADISAAELRYLLGRDNIHINILNQNIKLMPEKERFASLRRLSNSISQSVAHHAYFSQQMADRYDLPTLLLPAYTDLTHYPAASIEEKEKLIIYSPDDAPHKERCLEQLARGLPDFALVEIRDITFDSFMDLATRCLFSVSFGEGFDGYIAQPIYQGGIGLTVYNDDFFPSAKFKKYVNFFESEEHMVSTICSRIRQLLADNAAYVELNRELRSEYDALYNYDDYMNQIKKLSLKSFELFPHDSNSVRATEDAAFRRLRTGT